VASPRSPRPRSPRRSWRAPRVPRGDGRADPGPRGHAGAVHRRRHDDLLQRPTPVPNPRSARCAWRWPCASGSTS
jgi:hypothetical protein